MPETKPKFTVLKPRKKDIFDRIKLPAEEIALIKVKKALPEMIGKAVSEAVEKIEIPKPEKEIIREIRTENKVKDYEPEIKSLKDTIKSLKETIKQLKSQVDYVPMPGGPGVIGLPDPGGKNGRVLAVSSNQSKWVLEHPVGENWRIRESGTALVFERLESGTWTEKGAFTA